MKNNNKTIARILFAISAVIGIIKLIMTVPAYIALLATNGNLSQFTYQSTTTDLLISFIADYNILSIILITMVVMLAIHILLSIILAILDSKKNGIYYLALVFAGIMLLVIDFTSGAMLMIASVVSITANKTMNQPNNATSNTMSNNTAKTTVPIKEQTAITPPTPTTTAQFETNIAKGLAKIRKMYEDKIITKAEYERLVKELFQKTNL